MALRKVRDEAEARGSLAAVAASGLARSEWARRHGINPRSLNVWQINLERRARRASAAPLRLVELTPATAASPGSPYVVVVGDLRLEVGDDFVEESVRRLLAVLRSC